jgi:hypothetical protein
MKIIAELPDYAYLTAEKTKKEKLSPIKRKYG